MLCLMRELRDRGEKTTIIMGAREKELLILADELSEICDHLEICTDDGSTGFKGFVTGDWGLPEGVSFEDMDPDAMLPPAEAMPTVESMAQARELLAADKALAFEVLEGLSEEELASRELAAPWAPGDTFALGRHLLHSIRHTLQHKGQLFYYLKLQGKPVQTQDLWGM